MIPSGKATDHTVPNIGEIIWYHYAAMRDRSEVPSKRDGRDGRLTTSINPVGCLVICVFSSFSASRYRLLASWSIVVTLDNRGLSAAVQSF